MDGSNSPAHGSGKAKTGSGARGSVTSLHSPAFQAAIREEDEQRAERKAHKAWLEEQQFQAELAAPQSYCLTEQLASSKIGIGASTRAGCY